MPDDVIAFLVEANPQTRRAMMRMLVASGVVCEAFSELEDYLQVRPPNSKAVLILDIETAQKAKGRMLDALTEQDRALPVIYITDVESSRLQDKAKRAGAAGYFHKPVDRQALIDAIRFAARMPGPRPSP